jgi:cyanophycin synthetase
MLFRYKCLSLALCHTALQYLKRGGEEPPRSYKYENYSISKYLETAEKLNIAVTPLGFGMYELKKGDITRRIMSNLCMDGESVVAYKLCGNKYVTYKVLENNGIRHIPRHHLYTFDEVKKTCADFTDWNCPVVIKPCSGTSGGDGVTVNIRTLRELKRAICESFVHDRKAYLMEEFIEGSHFRLVTLKGEFIGCRQRLPARIIGNGKDSIRTLIRDENERRRNDRRDEALLPMPMDNEVARKLRSMHMSIGTIPKSGEEMYVRDTVNMHAGGSVRRIDNVSEDVKRMCRRIAEMLGIYVAGFDIITRDISKSLEETNGVINEVNTSPAMTAMYKVPPEEQPVHVAERIIESLFDNGLVPAGNAAQVAARATT